VAETRNTRHEYGFVLSGGSSDVSKQKVEFHDPAIVDRHDRE
jgi:hypothetical protein